MSARRLICLVGYYTAVIVRNFVKKAVILKLEIVINLRFISLPKMFHLDLPLSHKGNERMRLHG